MKRYKPILREKIIDQKNTNLKVEYKILNKKLFDNKLPDIPLKWVNNKSVGGKVISVGIRNKPETWKIKELQISLFTDMDYTTFLGILAHEMIHVYLISQGISDFGKQHGMMFLEEVKRINRMNLGFTVPIDEDITDAKVSKNIKSIKVGVVIVNDKYIQIYKFESMPEIIKRYREFPEEWKKKYKIEFYYSDNRELMKYPIKRKYTSGKFITYPVEKSLINTIKKEGEYIDTL